MPLVVALVSLGACAASEPTDVDVAGTDGPLIADVMDPSMLLDNYGYYIARPADAAGAYLVSAINLTTTRCGDGSYASECRVGELDVARLGLDAAGQKRLEEAAAAHQLIVQGDVGARSLVVKQAWIGEGESTGGGTFARVTATGVVCVAAPCPSFHGAVLNTKKETDLADVDLSAAGLTPRQQEGAQELIREPAGLIVAAKDITVTGPAGSMAGYQVNQVYLPVTKSEGTGATSEAPCYVGGCSSELCSDDPNAVSPCIFRAENECYRSATCERQADATCGWTQTDELRACLANPPALE
jgi:hypothetical protein